MGGLCRPIQLILVASAIVVGCDREIPGAIECSDPLGGELHGVFTPDTGPPITLGAVEPTPTLIHISATSEHPSGTYLALAAYGVYFEVVMSGEALTTKAIVDELYLGEGEVTIINSCAPRKPGERRRVTGTVSMSFNGQPIDGWFNGWFQD